MVNLILGPVLPQVPEGALLRAYLGATTDAKYLLELVFKHGLAALRVQMPNGSLSKEVT
jgi:hypothetical protein